VRRLHLTALLGSMHFQFICIKNSTHWAAFVHFFWLPGFIGSQIGLTDYAFLKMPINYWMLWILKPQCTLQLAS